MIDFAVSLNELRSMDPLALVQRLERRITNLDDTLARTEREHQDATAEASRAATRLGQPFQYADLLGATLRRQAEINDTLTTTPDAPTPKGPLGIG